MVYLGGLASCRLRAEAIGTRLWKAKAKWSMQVVGSSHSSDETCESRWSEVSIKPNTPYPRSLLSSSISLGG